MKIVWALALFALSASLQGMEGKEDGTGSGNSLPEQESESLCKQGQRYYEEGDVEQALAFLLRAANQGDIRAQVYLGMVYYDYDHSEEAEKWFNKAAEGENCEVLCVIGTYFFRQKKEVKTAVDCFIRAARQNYGEAFFNLGAISYDIEKDTEKALEWWRKGAEKGHLGCQNNLGAVLDDSGRWREAEGWLLQAAKQGHKAAESNLRRLYSRRDRSELQNGFRPGNIFVIYKFS